MSPVPLRRQIGQLLVSGFTGLSVPPDLRALAREFDLGGIILFARNVDSPGQVAEVAFEARNLGAELPAWVSVDQEGGRVARLRAPFTRWPPMATLGRSGSEELTRRFARALAVELRAVGISLDYAPVLDVHTNPSNQVIGDRALAGQADLVARLGRCIIEEMQGQGVAACGKHFPGHGDTAADSHEDLPIVEHPLDRLRAAELIPFKAAVDANVASIMTAHVLMTALDDERPATLSRRVVDGLLRQELGFGGMIVTDDLEMKAISGRRGIGEAAVAAVQAGCDLLLICSGDIDRDVAALEALIRAVESGTLPIGRVDDALARQRRVKERFLGLESGTFKPSPLRQEWRPRSTRALGSVLGCEAHQAVAEDMARFV